MPYESPFEQSENIERFRVNETAVQIFQPADNSSGAGKVALIFYVYRLQR